MESPEARRRERFAKRVMWITPIALVLVVVAIAWPGLRQSWRASNERMASMALKTIATAQTDFRVNDRDRNRVHDFWTGDVAGLSSIEVDGQPIKLIDPAVAAADAAPLKAVVPKPVPYHGYLFVVLKRDDGQEPPMVYGRHNTKGFGVCAYPADYGCTGRSTFYVNESNTIYKRDTGGKPMEAWPPDGELPQFYTPLD